MKFVWPVFSGMAVLLRFVDACEGCKNSAEFRTFLAKQPPGYLEARNDQSTYFLTAHHGAFDKGVIPCERLVEVLVPPFLKLVRAVSYEPSAADRYLHDTCSNLLHEWNKGISNALVGSFRDSPGGRQYSQNLSPRKRAEFVKALMAAKFPEVRVYVGKDTLHKFG